MFPIDDPLAFNKVEISPLLLQGKNRWFGKQKNIEQITPRKDSF
jgi:hypothetical protein